MKRPIAEARYRGAAGLADFGLVLDFHIGAEQLDSERQAADGGSYAPGELLKADDILWLQPHAGLTTKLRLVTASLASETVAPRSFR